MAVSADERRWLLLNASPDIRSQIEATPPLHPRTGVRSSPIAAVALSNADIDHVAGLLSLREEQPFVLYGSERVHAALRANPIFNVLREGVVRREVVSLGRPFGATGPDGEPLGIAIEMFAVPGKAALYLEDEAAGAEPGTAAGDTVGLRLRAPPDGGRSLFYIPGCAAVTADLAGRLAGAALVLFDGTLWRDDEMIRAGAGRKTGRRMGHVSMDGPQGSLAAFRALGVERKVFVHLNNTNPVLLADSPERAAVEAAGWEVAEDGMELRL